MLKPFPAMRLLVLVVALWAIFFPANFGQWVGHVYGNVLAGELHVIAGQ